MKSWCFMAGNNRKKVDWLAKKMRESNFPIAAIHGDMPQKELSLMARYKEIYPKGGPKGNLW